MRAFGSSPLARGTSEAMRAAKEGLRLIPARAGNILYMSVVGFGLTAHPRSRGEHLDGELEPRDAFGSSPLARGTSVKQNADDRARRLIPARAGNI